MQALELITVAPYKVPVFGEVEFSHHYKHGDTIYKAGNPVFQTSDELPEDSDARDIWEALNWHLMEEVPEITRRAAELDEMAQRHNAEARAGATKLRQRLLADPRNPNGYFTITKAHARHVEVQAEQGVLMAKIQRGNAMKAVLSMHLQRHLRILLPIRICEMQDAHGEQAVVPFVWHCPAQRVNEATEDTEPAEDMLNPHALRDFGKTLQGLFSKQEYEKLCQDFPPRPKKIIQTFQKQDVNQHLKVLKKLT